MEAADHAFVEKAMQFMRKALCCATGRADVISAKPEADSVGSLSAFPKKTQVDSMCQRLGMLGNFLRCLVF